MSELWSVLLLDTKRRNPNHYLCLALEDALRGHPAVARVTQAGYHNAVELARTGDYNFFLAFDGEEVDQALCVKVAALCKRSVLWVTEDPYELSINQGNVDLFDLILTNDAASVGAYGPVGRHLPLAASRAFHYHELKPEGHPYLYDVFFAGTAWPNRVALIRELLEKLPDLKCKIALPFNPHILYPMVGLPKAAIVWRTPNSEFCRLANRSRITLALHRDFSSSDNPGMAATPGPRLFEVALAGGFQLIDGSLAESALYYRPGAEVEIFSSVDDCVEKVRHFLAAPEAREAMARATQQTTLERHLYHHRVTQIFDWLAALPAKSAETSAAETTPAAKRNLLFVAHNGILSDRVGGVEVVMQTVANRLREEFNVFYYVPVHAHDMSVGAVLSDAEHLELRRFEFPPIANNSLLSCPAREAAFAQLLSDYAIDLVHYHHLLGHVPSLPFISKAYGIPGALTLHDYFFVCSRFNLIDYAKRFCHAETIPLTTCDVCLNAEHHYPAYSQQRRRAFMQRMLGTLDLLIFHSRDTQARYEKIYPLAHLPKRSFLISCPVPYAKEPVIESPRRWTSPLKVAVFGNFTLAKGADVMLRAFNQLRDCALEFHIYGRLDSPYDQVFEALAFKNVFVYEQFTPGTLGDVLKETALSLHLSIWPETFCITLSEAMHFRVVPIVSDLGAPSERVIHGVNGFKVPAQEPGALVALLRNLSENPDPGRRCHDRLRDMEEDIQGGEEHARAMAEQYRLLERAAASHSASAESPARRRANLTLFDCGIQLEHVNWALQGAPFLPPAAEQAAASDLEAQLQAPEEREAALAAAAGGADRLFSPFYIAQRAGRMLRERGPAQTARWHWNTVKKLVGAGGGKRAAQPENGDS